MNDIEMFDSAIEKWRLGRGIGTMICEFPYNKKYPMTSVLSKIYSKSPNCKTLIVVSNFTIRKDVINEVKKEMPDNNNVKVLTQSFIEEKGNGQGTDLCICYGISVVSDNLMCVLSHSTYKLVILHRKLNTEVMNKLYFIAPLIKDFCGKSTNVDIDSSPVEEELIGLPFDQTAQEFKLLQYYNKEIENAISIFNDFDTIKKARVGDKDNNISATSICYDIAKNNGWNESLDMSVPINQELDKYYNPIAIHERAESVYEIIRNRANLLTDYKSKLDKVLEIVKSNSDKRILIISKRSDFANEITNRLNANFIECMNYHDNVEPIVATDDDGNVIRYKSGEKKGEVKYFASKAQKNVAQSKFRKGAIKVLSTNNSPDKNLSIDIDVVIITSSVCNDIREYMYRLSKSKFASPLKLYTLYMLNSLESKRIDGRKYDRYKHTVKIGNSSDVSFDCDDYVLVD